MADETKPLLRNELLDYLAGTPSALDAHSRWLNSGGEHILDKAVDLVRGDLFPYNEAPHVQAAFGAFCSGASWMARLLKKLVILTTNRKELAKMLVQAEGAFSAEEKKALRELYGYSDAELADYEKQLAGASPSKPKRVKKV